MLDLINILGSAGTSADDIITKESELCEAMSPVMQIIGIVILGIKIVVPIVLIIIGMIDLAKAVGQKDENEIKKAQNLLIKKAIVAVIVFLVITFVGIIFQLVGNGGTKYKDSENVGCWKCITDPFGNACKGAVKDAKGDYGDGE